jgi:DNA-binding response OmpR family regulator
MASIVLADDDEDLRAIYGPCLRSAGHTVREASGGTEALELVREHRPDLLILDVWMPRCNGFEVLEALKHDPASTGLKILMLSNLGDADTRLECFEMGASEYLVKGMSLVEFRDKVGEILEAPRQA